MTGKGGGGEKGGLGKRLDAQSISGQRHVGKIVLLGVGIV